LLIPLLTLEVENSTPLLIGGYDGQAYSKYHEEELRTQSIKGLWRWWLRAFLAGRYWSSGDNDEILINKVVNETGEILGRASGEGGACSRITVISLTEKADYSMVKSRGTSQTHLELLPKVKHLLLGREIKYITNIRAKIKLMSYIFKDEELDEGSKRLALASFIASLLFSGLGKGGRRGLGSLDFKIVDDKTGYFGLLDSNEVNLEGIARIFKLANVPQRTVQKRLPLIPSVAPTVFKAFMIKSNGKRILDVVGDLQNFTLRSIRDRIFKGDPFRRKHYGWILGLPREARRTGYKIIDKDKINRRASPIFFCVHRKYATACIFRSRDWPSMVSWSSTDSKEVSLRIGDKELNEAYDLLENTFITYLEKLGYRYEEVQVFE